MSPPNCEHTYFPTIHIRGRELRPIHFHRLRSKCGLVNPILTAASGASRSPNPSPVRSPLASAATSALAFFNLDVPISFHEAA